VPDLHYARNEIDRMRIQVGCQRKEILQLQRANISTASAELPFGRMLARIETPSALRDEMRKGQPSSGRGRVPGGSKW
jgi:hypothetical protein